jgi:hypothetical protein
MCLRGHWAVHFLPQPIRLDLAGGTWESPASASNSGRFFCLKRKDDLTKHGTRDVTRYPTRNKGNTVKSPLLKLIAHLLFSLCGAFFEKNELT